MTWLSQQIDSHIIKMKSLNADVFVDVRLAQVRSAGHQEDSRDRLEATPYPHQRLRLGGCSPSSQPELMTVAEIISSATTSRIRPIRIGRTIRHEGLE